MMSLVGSGNIAVESLSMSSFYIWFPLVITLVIAFAVTIFEGILRRGTTSKSARESADDKGTTGFIAVAFVISWIAILLSIPLNRFGIAIISPHLVLNVVGLVLMVIGICIRTFSAQTLGRYYSRTLVTETEQHLVTRGIYGVIRHPGYLGTITLFTGAAIAVSNFVTVLLIVLAILPVYIHRISMEEKMLRKVFGDEFAQYTSHTKKLIPFIY